MSEFCHLHCHSEYSLLDGMSRLEDMVLRAKELNQPAIALTDHGVMFGAIEFYRAAKKHGIKPIMGVEAYLAARGMKDRDSQIDRRSFHMLLLAQNQTGYQNLLKLSSDAQLKGFYQKPRIDRDLLAEHAAGVIATTGCLAGEVPRTLIQEGEKAAYEKLKWYLDVFGRDRFFLELQGHDIPDLRRVNNVLLDWSRKHEVGLIATNDVHYVRKDDAAPHEVLLCMQTRDVLTNPKRMQLTPHGSYYITSSQEMARMFGDYPDALRNTIRIAEMCEVDLDPKGYHLPIFPVPEGYDAHTYLVYLVEKGLEERYGEYRAKHDPVVRERIERELGIIHNMGFDTYFLIVWDLCLFAAREDIWWNVRGSGAGSVVAYTLRITNIDPIKNDLIFERFLNPHRVSMPDFDLDFPDDRRYRMIEYAVEKYGKDRCAAIITFGTLGARAAVRDVGRTLGMDLPNVNRIARMMPSTGKVKLKKVLFDDSALEEWPLEAAEIREVYKKERQIKKLLDTAMKLEGQTRHASTHAAGIVISDKPIVEYAPLHRSTKGNDSGPIQQVVQFDMNIVESIGLLKVDFLGLATLSVMRRACEHIAQRHGRELNLNNIPYERNPDDPEFDANLMKAYKLLQAGETVGVFQVESDGLRRVLQEMLPDQFEHIIAAISLYRPGPLEYIPTYIERMHGREEVAYHHPLQEPILKNTYGICVSGDAIVIDAQTGQRYRLDEVGALSDFMIQGVDERWQPAVGHVTHWIDSGHKPVYEVTLRNGASIKVTEDHRLLTEEGWQPLKALKVGDYIGTPRSLYGAKESKTPTDRRRLRVLAYLITNGSLATGTVVDFVSKNANLVEEHIRCLGVFENLRTSTLTQIREVTRVSVAKESGDYHDANSLLLWMRELGFKHPPGSKPGGLRSHEKFVPRFVFELGADDIRFFLASLWDCDGYMSKKFCHYKTISAQLAEDVRTLLLRLGIQSTTYTASYQLERGDGSKETRTSYQVTVFDAKQLAELLQPDMISEKRLVKCTGEVQPTIARDKFISELDATTSLSRRALQDIYGISRQHFTPKNRKRPRISGHVVKPLTEYLDLPQTSRSLNVVWQEVLSIEPAGASHVYDLTVEGLHSFVANQIIVHNCVYQEQIMRMASDIAGYSPGEADLMRRAVSKKKAKEIERHKQIFIEGAGKNGVDRKSATRIYEDIEFFARYGFNKSHAADYAVITVQTAYLKAHYPVEYLCALLEVEFDDSAKVPVLINECRRLGIDVLQPDINASGARFTIEQNPKNKHLPKNNYRRWAIRVGLGAIKSVGLAGVESLILAEREAKGLFKTLDDFAERVNLRLLKRSVVKNLATVGSFDELARPIVPDTPREVVTHKEVIDRMMGVSSSIHAAASIGQLSMFGMMAAATPKVSRTSVLKPLPNIGKVDVKKRLDNEKELLGIYISEHPLQQIASQVGKKISHFCSDITEELVEQRVKIAGLLVGTPRVITTKKGKPMAFIKLEDLEGQIEVVVFPRTYEQAKDILLEDQIFLVQGKVNLRNDSLSVLADQIKLYQPGDSSLNGSKPNVNGVNGTSPEPNHNGSTDEDSSSLQCHITLTMQRTDDHQEDLTRLERVMLALQEHKGRDKLSLRCIIPNGNIVQMDFPKLSLSWNAALKDIIDSQNMLLDFKDITPSKKRKYRKRA